MKFATIKIPEVYPGYRAVAVKQANQVRESELVCLDEHTPPFKLNDLLNETFGPGELMLVVTEDKENPKPLFEDEEPLEQWYAFDKIRLGADILRDIYEIFEGESPKVMNLVKRRRKAQVWILHNFEKIEEASKPKPNNPTKELVKQIWLKKNGKVTEHDTDAFKFLNSSKKSFSNASVCRTKVYVNWEEDA